MPCETMKTCVADITGVVQFGANAALVATAPGESTKTAVADAAGAYTFRFLPPGTWTLCPSAAEVAAYEYTPASVSVTLSGNGRTAIAPTMTREPLLSTTPWLPQCKSVDAGAANTLLAQPARAPASSASVVNTGMTGDEYLANTGFDASKLVPMPLPIADGNVTSAAVCASDAAYSVGPTSSRTTCWLVSCFSGQCPTKYSICSGTFVLTLTLALTLSPIRCIRIEEVIRFVYNNFVSKNASICLSCQPKYDFRDHGTSHELCQ